MAASARRGVRWRRSPSLGLRRLRLVGARPDAGGCLGEPAALARALERAPGAGRARRTARALSRCVQLARAPTATCSRSAISLMRGRRRAARARAQRDPGAALRLGYLVGAVRARRARDARGLAAQLARRIEQSAALRRRRAARGAGRAARAASRARRGRRMKLRLYHHRDGARIAYREAGVGPGLCLVHSAALSHREFVPLVEHLTDRFRLVLPDLPLHGDSEDRPRHPYTLDWLAEVMADVLPRDVRARTRSSAATARARRSCCARSSPGSSRRRGSCSCPTACTARRRARGWPCRCARSRPRRRCRASTALRRARRAPRLPARARDEAHRARQPGGARPRAPRDGGRRRQREPRALVVALGAPLAGRRADRPARGLPAHRRAASCCCGPTATATTRSPAPRRRATCCPTRCCACCRARAFSSPTTTRSASRAS